MKKNSKSAVSKLTQLVLAACVGSLIWTGCSSTQPGTYSANQADETSVVAPIDQSKANARPDTHPELRTALSAEPQATQLPVAPKPGIETINPGPGTAVFEAAGAEPTNAEIKAYLDDLQRRVSEIKN